MGQKKISQLPQDSSPTTNDSIPTYDADTVLTKRVLISDLINFFFNNVSASVLATALSNVTSLNQNWLINGGMDVWQRNTSASPNDDVYSGCDRWNFLAEANASWTIARDTDVPSGGGSRYSMKCSNVTLNNQMAIVQFLEGKDAMRLQGKTVSLSFWAKTNSTEIGALRAAILSWTSTEDAVTSDVIGTWAQNGTNPTWATNWTIENTPSNLSLTSSWQKFTIENVAIDTASMKNIAVVIWVDDGTIAANDDFYITQVQMNEGTEAMPFETKNYIDIFELCQRFYQIHSGPAYRIYHNNVQRWSSVLPVEMRTSPTTVHTLTGSGIAADNTAGTARAIQYDTQFTGGGTGVIDATWTTLTFDAEL